MFESNDKVGNIEALEQRIKQEEEHLSPANNTGYWQKLTAYCEKLSADQLNFINNDPEVLNFRERMMEAFNLYLFEKFKNEFAAIENVQPFCEDYMNSVYASSKKYTDEVVNAVKENKELKAKLKEMEKKLNDKNNSKGTGQSGRIRSE